MTTRAEIKAICKRSLEQANIGIGEEGYFGMFKPLITELAHDEHHKQHRYKELYEYMFTNFPDLRVYFKGAENFSGSDVMSSERFKKQGQHILLAMRILVNVCDDDLTFRAYARETVNRHREYKLDPLLWKAFFTVFVGFLGTKTTLDEATKKAWTDLGKAFAEECWKYLREFDFQNVNYMLR